jgi:hypothetical protein
MAGYLGDLRAVRKVEKKADLLDAQKAALRADQKDVTLADS